jgi:uncharacterized protein YkwD
MSAVQPPALWLSVAATAVCVVAVAAMATSEGPRRPLTFAGAILLPGGPPGSSSPAAQNTTQPSRPSASPTRARTSAVPPAAASTAGAPTSMPAVIAPPNTSAGTGTPPASPSPPSAVAAPASRTPGRANTPQTGAPARPATPSSASVLAQALFTAVNDVRQRAGLPSLSWSAELHRSAAAHNRQMASANELAFRIGDEPALGVRQANQGVLGNYAAENVGSTQATGLAGALAVHQQMLTEQSPDDSRRQNLLSPMVNTVGIDVLLDPANGRMWITQDFAQLNG